jgi:N-acetylglucosaminyl-diphospho-decaprenol L-rhamnosyltransferase
MAERTSAPRIHGGIDRPSLGAVIVVHNSERYLELLLASVARHLSPLPELVVVDTGRPDRAGQIARCYGATVIERPDNPGFGAANNLGIAKLSTDVCALLNPDVELLDDGLMHLVTMAAADRGLFAPSLVNPDGSLQRSAHPAPGRLDALLPALIHPLALPREIRLHADPWRARESRTVGWAMAACLVAQTAIFRQLGPFDERIFLFYEDLDLGLRARRAGIRTELHPEVAVRHFGGHSTLPAYGHEPIDLHARLRREIVGRQLGRAALAIDDLSQGVAFSTRAAARKLLGRTASRELTQLRALIAALRNS